MPFVVTADRRNSREHPGELDMAAHRDRLRSQIPGATLDWQISAGDELQALYSDPGSAVEAALQLLEAQLWHVGVGVGPVDTPLPATVSEATGDGFVNARHAVEAAKSSATDTAIRGAGAGEPAVQQADALLSLLAAVRRRRTPTARQAAALADRGLAQQQIAEQLSITQSSVSRRLSTALWQEEHAVRTVLVDLLQQADREGEAHE